MVLTVSLIDAGAGLYVPKDGDLFEIVSASLDLNFINHEFPQFRHWLTKAGYWGNLAIHLLLRVAEHLADFDGDLDIDGRDFLAGSVALVSLPVQPKQMAIPMATVPLTRPI